MAVLNKGGLVITCCFLNVFMTVHLYCTDLINKIKRLIGIKYS